MQNSASPRISVVVPTYGRGIALWRLLDSLTLQTLPREEFEVIVVDDGSPEPISYEPADFPYALTILRQENAGPGAARNRGFEECTAPLVLILNDDAIPAPDLLERHLAAHERAPERTAVLGTFRFSAEARRSPFTRLLDETNLLFSFKSLRPGELHDWCFFWTCNISLPVEAIAAVGGFDAENFPEALVEDVELGYRLEQDGWRIYHADDCVCLHEHRFTPTGFLDRAQRLGRYITRMHAKHGEASILWAKDKAQAQIFLENGLNRFELHHQAIDKLNQALEQVEEQYADKPLPAHLLAKAEESLKDLGFSAFLAGVHQEVTGVDPVQVAKDGPPTGELTSIIVVSYDQLAHTQRCIEDLRAAHDERWPIELIVVDNGSTDGSAEWLEQQQDLILIRNESNLGAPHARNQALALAKGAWVAFLDNDVFVPTGWLERALYHGAVDPRVGAIALVANRASKLQQVDYGGDATVASIEAHAQARYQDFARRGRNADLFTSLAVLLRREVIDHIGGFDERFSPWGFEDDDLALRVRFAGWRVRVAQDTFVFHAPYPDQAKHERHSGHLHRNWERFAEKWGPGGPAPKLFDYAALNLSEAQFSAEQLVVPLDEALSVPEASAPSEPCDQGPWPLATECARKVVAWPRYDEASGDLEALLKQWAQSLVSEGACLCLRHDEDFDGPLDAALARLEAAFLASVDKRLELDVLIVDDRMTAADLERLGQAVQGLIELPGCDDTARAAFANALGCERLSPPIAAPAAAPAAAPVRIAG